MTSQFKELISELEPLPSWVRSDMNKIQKLDRAKVDAQNLLYRIARNFFQHAEKNKKSANSVAKEKRKAAEKIRQLQNKIQVMSSQKVDLANKVMQFAQLSLDQVLQGASVQHAKTPKQGAGAKSKREAKANEKLSKKQRKASAAETAQAKQKNGCGATEEPRRVQPEANLVQPVSFELNCQFLRGFGPPIMLETMQTLEQIEQNRHQQQLQSRASKKQSGGAGQRTLIEKQGRAGGASKAQKADRVPAGPGQEPTYCFCNNVSYGDMIACDNQTCMYEWFHFPCVGLSKKPQPGQLWYCQKCAPSFQRNSQLVF